MFQCQLKGKHQLPSTLEKHSICQLQLGRSNTLVLSATTDKMLQQPTKSNLP